MKLLVLAAALVSSLVLLTPTVSGAESLAEAAGPDRVAAA